MAEPSRGTGKRDTDETKPERTTQPADEPVADEPVFDDPYFNEADFDEPVVDEPVFDEPVFDEQDFDEPAFERDNVEPARAASSDDFVEPVFDAEAAGADPERDVRDMEAIRPSTRTSPLERLTALRSRVGRFAFPGGQSQEETTGESASTDITRKQGRRLGRTGPFWMLSAGVAVVLLLAIWFGFFRTSDDLADRQLTPAAQGLAGSVDVPDQGNDAAPAATPSPEASPTDTPIPVLTVGQEVVVGNTDGAGIRLRNEPGLNGLTLAIYDEGDAFTVLNPDGDYSEYPVEADGYHWYRIQIAGNPDENLSGWAVGDFLVATD